MKVTGFQRKNYKSIWEEGKKELEGKIEKVLQLFYKVLSLLILQRHLFFSPPFSEYEGLDIGG